MFPPSKFDIQIFVDEHICGEFKSRTKKIPIGFGIFKTRPDVQTFCSVKAVSDGGRFPLSGVPDRRMAGGVCTACTTGGVANSFPRMLLPFDLPLH